jgi:hypothetical protein
MEQEYEAKYKTGLSNLFLNAIFLVVAAILLITFFYDHPRDLIVYSVAALVFFIFSTLASLYSYSEIFLYPDRMEVKSLIDGITAEVYYSDITHAGILHGRQPGDSTHGSRIAITKTDVLVIMLKDGREFKLSSSDYPDVSEIRTFIQEKIGHVDSRY